MKFAIWLVGWLLRALLPINSYWSFTEEKRKEVEERKGGTGGGNFDQTLPLGDRFGLLTCTEGGHLSTRDLGLTSHPNDGGILTKYYNLAIGLVS